MSMLMKRFYDFIIRFQIYIVILYGKYCTIFASSKPFEDELNKKKKIVKVKKIEKRIENNIDNNINNNIDNNVDNNKIHNQLEDDIVKKSDLLNITNNTNSNNVNNENDTINKVDDNIETNKIDSIGKKEDIKENIEENKSNDSTNTEDDNNEKRNGNEDDIVYDKGTKNKKNKKNLDVNEKLKETINNLSYEEIRYKLKDYKSIFNEIIQKCRNKAVFLYNKYNFTNFDDKYDYDGKYIKINDIFTHIDEIGENEFKINSEDISAEYIIDEKESDLENEILLIKDPVYNFVYSIRCSASEVQELHFLNETPGELYHQNDGYNEKYLFKNDLYLYINEKVEKEQTQNDDPPTINRYMIFFKYLLSLLDNSDIYCSKIENKTDVKYFVKAKKKINIFTAIGLNKQEPITYDTDDVIIEGVIKY